MKASDWIALLGAVVSAGAIFVSAIISLVAVRIQRYQSRLEREQADEDFRGALSELARSLSQALTRLFILPPGQELGLAMTEVMGLVATANELVGDGNGGTWFLHQSLALAYGWMQETEKADANWRKALEKAGNLRARISILTSEGVYHYGRGASEIDAGRSCFDKAVAILEKTSPSDVGVDWLISVLVSRAGLEFMAGERGESTTIYAKAWQQCKSLTATWRRARAMDGLADSLLWAFGQDPAGLPDTLPVEMIVYAEDRRHHQQQAVVPQQQDAFLPQQAPSDLQRAPDDSAINQQPALPAAESSAGPVPGPEG